MPEPNIERGRIECEVLDLNRFGNVQLNVRESHLTAAGLDGSKHVSIEALSGAVVASRVSTYADIDAEGGVDGRPARLARCGPGEPGNAAEGLGVSSGDLIWIRDGS